MMFRSCARLSCRFMVVFLLLQAVLVYSAEVSEKAAMKAGLSHLNMQRVVAVVKDKKSALTIEAIPASNVRETITVSDKGRAIYYIFNLDPEGWFIVSADDVARPILAYSLTGTYTLDDQSPATKWWMGNVKREISNAIEEQMTALADAKMQWKELNLDPAELKTKDISAYAAASSVTPMITTTWGQGGNSIYGIWYKSYDYYCPWEKSWGLYKVAPTGCVATSLAQIMNYWQWPPVGRESHTWDPPYVHNNNSEGYDYMEIDYTTRRYNWSIMPVKVSEHISQDPRPYEGGLEVARLMRDIGHSINMDYMPGGSEGKDLNIQEALKSHFRYHCDELNWPRRYLTTQEWVDLLKAELSDGRPISYAGEDPSGGHEFVCDGYDNSGMFHFNWGWNGSKDGYYSLDDLTPGSYDFTSNQFATMGIKPNYPGEIWVDPDYSLGGDNDGHLWGWDALDTLEAALAISDGDTKIYMAAGSYYSVHLEIDIPVTIIGAGVGETIVEGVQTLPTLKFVSGANGAYISGIRFYDGGGAIEADGVGVRVTDCHFRYNLPSNSGAITTKNSGSATVTNCSFYRNSSGVYVDTGSTATITNCTLYYNIRGLTNNDGTARAANCIFWANTIHQIGGTGTFDITYSDIAGGYSGTGNINADPQLADGMGENFHLTGNSPCLDKGNNSATAIPSRDYDGNVRKIDGDSNGSVIVDMGCDEYAKVYYVKANATGSNNGLSWENAFTSLQSALAVASPTNEIWVAAGTYKPGSSGERSATFTLKKGVAMYGGFSGDTSAAWEDRAPETYKTYLSGDLNGNGRDNNDSYHVLWAKTSGLDNSSLVDGLIITGGNANGSYPDYRGGGIYIESCSPRFVNCTFENNYADDRGGAISEYGSSTLIENCLFRNNNSDAGGAVRFGYSSAIMRGCIFENNNSTGSGGAVYLDSNSVPEILSCGFYGNSAITGGAIYFANGSNICPISNCVFSANTASQYGGAIYGMSCSFDVINSTFWNNNGISGGIRVSSGFNVRVLNSIFWANSSGQIYISNTTSSVTYSLVQGGYSGAGNINIDPLFIDPDGADNEAGTLDDDLRITENSSCVNHGSVTGSPAEDFFGMARDGIADIGYHEIMLARSMIIYVNDDASGGKNGLSWANAFTELDRGLYLAEPGDAVWVAGGTYKPTIRVTADDSRSVAFQLKNGVEVLGGFAGDEDPGTFDLAARDIAANETVLSGDIGTSGTATDNSYHVFYHPAELDLDNTAILDGCTIANGYNSGDTDSINGLGAGMYNYSCSPTIQNCRFHDNSCSGGNGGGMYNYNSSPEITDCIFDMNYTKYYGGAMYNHTDSMPIISKCLFEENEASSGGAISHIDCPGMQMEQCMIRNNTARQGSAMYMNYFSEMNLSNCTIYNNVDAYEVLDARNMAIFNLSNCIVWGNDGDAIYNGEAYSYVQNSNIEGSGGSENWNWQFGEDLGGNIDQDPRFDPSNMPQLLADSPCIDAGYNDQNLSSIDYFGNKRLADGNCDMVATVDMGIYEYSHRYQGDYNEDCVVNMVDFNLLSLCWYSGDGDCVGVDLTGDGDIDINDLQLLSSLWLTDERP